MQWFVLVVLCILGLAVFFAYRLGRSKEKKDQVAKQAEERVKDAEIASKPYVDKPFGGMRPKG